MVGETELSVQEVEEFGQMFDGKGDVIDEAEVEEKKEKN
jgi:hypothetical protein